MNLEPCCSVSSLLLRETTQNRSSACSIIWKQHNIKEHKKDEHSSWQNIFYGETKGDVFACCLLQTTQLKAAQCISPYGLVTTQNQIQRPWERNVLNDPLQLSWRTVKPEPLTLQGQLCCHRGITELTLPGSSRPNSLSGTALRMTINGGIPSCVTPAVFNHSALHKWVWSQAWLYFLIDAAVLKHCLPFSICGIFFSSFLT